MRRRECSSLLRASFDWFYVQRAFLCDANRKKKVDLLGKKCVRVRREDTRSLYTHTLHIHKKDERNNEMSQQPQPEEVMHQVQAELANAYAQEFFTTVREKCFKMCVAKPSSSLSSYERKCLEQCTERYVDATRMISQVVLKQYSSGGGSGGM
jgi:import inner membrane translocase subunit TIM13